MQRHHGGIRGSDQPPFRAGSYQLGTDRALPHIDLATERLEHDKDRLAPVDYEMRNQGERPATDADIAPRVLNNPNVPQAPIAIPDKKKQEMGPLLPGTPQAQGDMKDGTPNTK